MFSLNSVTKIILFKKGIAVLESAVSCVRNLLCQEVTINREDP